MSNESLLATLTPDTREKVEELLALARERYGYNLKIVSARRTCEEQARLYAIGRTAPGQIVTNSRGCMSWHTMGRAVDLAFVSPNPTIQDWDNLGDLGQSIGFIWGKYFTGLQDLPHFEYHPGVKIEQLCHDPSDCEGGVRASMSYAGGASSGGVNWWVVAAAAGAAAVIYLLADEW
jgi:peptidoglycan L-alanyl-D-glutamate endopeptidase CwlK